ncbi:MAG: hypothetical protein RIE59_08075 [Imperialibacter sp.]
MKTIVLIALLSSFLFINWQPASVADKTMADEFIVEPSTLLCAGFEWKIFGDDNRNATVSVEYRKKGDTQWKQGHPMLRIGDEKVYGHDQRWVYTVPDMFAGSIFNLEPDTWYEGRFILTDPDGVSGIAEKIVTFKTRAEPQPYVGGQTYHVYPIGYDGPKESPAFTGLNAAYYGEGNQGDWWMVPEPRVQPGDVILVHAGLYKGDRRKYAHELALDFHGAYVLTQKGTPEKPITIKSAGDGEVIFDGDGAYRLFDVMAADYHYFEGLTIRNTDVAFYAGLKRVMGASGLTVKHCKMEDIGMAVMTHSADSKDFYIADNTLIGRHEPDTLIGWYGFEKPAPLTSYVAIKVYGQGHVVCHNAISFFHDGISVDTHGLPEEGKPKCASIDFYRNDIFNMADDFIEADGGVHNIRVFENRGFNSYHASLSAQPMFGGPVYFIRNICYNTPGTALKYMIRPAGIYTYNNTFITEAAISVFSNGHFRNNLFMGPSDSRPALSATTLTTYSTMDYNGYRKKSGAEKSYRLRYPTTDAQNHADEKELTWVEASSLKELGKLTGFELHGTELDFDAFENVPVPDKRGHIYAVEGVNFSLRKGSKAIDAGVAIPNVTDGSSGKAPDLGALEAGAAMPVYGPRN